MTIPQKSQTNTENTKILKQTKNLITRNKTVKSVHRKCQIKKIKKCQPIPKLVEYKTKHILRQN